MASLDKLAIRGIRSFDDKHVQVIQFYSPLTVIVGHNGSGKTTIIECLKYATTGDLPPNTKGGAFVHDPKMANEKEVKAQVRLRFFNTKRQKITATRSLQVSTKKTGGLTMKTLEGLLATSDEHGDGKRNTISTKCAEMDEEVPSLLGVSRSILENVIFCHQEDSNWPLSEPAALKKKFDDIFEATKYTKALDNIKAIRKERAAELKVDNERLKFMRSDRDKAQRLRKELDDMVRRENSKQTEVENSKDEFDRLQEQNQHHSEQAHGYTVIFERVESLNARKKMLVKNCERMLEGMTVLNDSTEELSNQYRNFDSHLQTIEAKRDKQIQLRDKEDEALEDLRRRERNLLSAQGALQNNRKMYERNLRDRETTVRTLSRNHNIAGYDYSPLEEAKVTEFLDRLQDLVRKAETDLRRTIMDGDRKERGMRDELDRLAQEKSVAVTTKDGKLAQITSLTSQIRQMESNFHSISSVDADISVMQNDITASEERHKRLDEDIQQAKYDDQLRACNADIRQKEAEKDKVNSELSLLNRQAESRAQLAIKRSELESKTAQMTASISSHSARFKELVGSDINKDTMEQSITTATVRKDRELQDAEAVAAANNRTLSQLQTTLNYAKQGVKDKTAELARLDAQIVEALSESEQSTVAEAIEECLAEINAANDEINDKEGMIKFYDKIQQIAERKNKCMGCDRTIHANEKSAFEIYIKTRLDRCKRTNVDETKAELAQWETILDGLRRAVPATERVEKLKSAEIPAAQKQIAQDQDKLDATQKEVEDAQMVVQSCKLAVRDLQTLKSAAVIVTRTANEIKDLEQDIQRLERDLQSTGSLKTVEEVQREVDDLSAAIKILQREVQQLSSEKEVKINTLHTLSGEINRKTMRLGELNAVVERRRMQEAALKEKQAQLVGLQSELKDLDAKAAATIAPWKEKNEALTRYHAERVDLDDDARTQVGIYQSSVSDIESKHRQCTQYITEGNDRKIRENDSHLEDIRREVTATQDGRAVIEGNIASIQEDISSASVTRKNIKYNLDYREEEREVQKVTAELDSIDIDQAAKARREFNSKYNTNVKAANDVHAQWQLASGVLLQMTEQRKGIEKTLKSEYNNIDDQFRAQLVKTRLAAVANSDLEKYGKALDNAILKYHSVKMAEINDTIGHLWNKTYQGTDIDNIKIVSDHDETSTSTRKSYNYRVVMIKNDVELDMRGRCSAGQKVLASIIIRLGLAESFGQGCGVLALDEPTTNLDQENINALAESLAEIIRERRRQANFQLIVITHDEGFLQRLAAQDVLEHYWRVSRDAQQKSSLERQRVGL